MADLISEIISPEALDQIRELNNQLEASTSKMESLIVDVAKFNSTITGNSVKDTTAAITQFNEATTKLTAAENDRLAIEKQIKAEGEKMAAAVKLESNAIDEASKKYKVFSNSQKEIATYIQQTEERLNEIKIALKNADRSASNYAEATASLKLEQAKLKSELASANLELKNTIKEQKFAADSMDGMSVRLAQLKGLYASFTEEERNSDFGMTISQGINELDDKIKGLDKSIGNNQRNVGNYEVASKSLKGELREIIQELGSYKLKMDAAEDAIKQQKAEVDRLAASNGKNSDEYKVAVLKLKSMENGLKTAGIAMSQLEKRGGELQDAMDDARRSVKGMSDDAGNTKAVAEGVGVLADSFSVFQAGMVAVGADGEELMNVYAKMMIVQQGFNALTQITNALQAESTLRLKLKMIWEKAALVFTQKKTAATVAETAAETGNTAATVGATAATAGLATAEGVATKTSWTLTGSIKAVGAAIKSIPVVGWILAAVAALGTLTVLLYKHIQAEKELTTEQVMRKKVSENNLKIHEEVRNATEETLLKVKLYNRELKDTQQGSKKWNDILKLISNETGIQVSLLKGTPANIQAITDKWAEQYVLRIKSETIIKQMAENSVQAEMNVAKIRQNLNEENVKEIVKTMNLTNTQQKELIKNAHLYQKASTPSGKTIYMERINKLLDQSIAQTNNLNNSLEKQVDIESLMNNEKGESEVKTKNQIKSTQDLTIEIRKLKNELYNTGENLIIESTSIELAQLEKSYKEEYKRLKEQHQSTEELEQLHQLQIEKITRDGYAKLQEFREKNLQNMIDARIQEEVENQKREDDYIETAKNIRNGVLEWTNKYLNDQKQRWDEEEEQLEKEKQLRLEQLSATNDLLGALSNLGVAISQNIKDEKERIIVEQRIAEVQILLSNAIAIAQTLIDKGDPYTKAIRIAANLAAIAAGFIQAEQAIAKAKSVSAYAEGTDYHKGGAALVGEGGQPEFIQTNTKSFWVDKPTIFYDLPVGASVTPLSEMNDSNITNSLLQQLVDKNGSQVNIDVSGRILPTLIKDGKVIRFANKLIKARA